jgi:hypothetical protein
LSKELMMVNSKGTTVKSKRRTLPKAGMDVAKAPKWWLTKPQEIREYLESLKGVTVEEIGRSAGGRPIIAASWGEREMLPGRTSDNLASAASGGSASAFYGEGKRSRQVVMFVGAAHGTEFEGTVSMLNLLNVVVTGKDLLGRKQPDMAAAGRKHRWIVIPILNMDGRERLMDHVSFINVNDDYFSMVTQGLKKNGEIMQWPTSKLLCPIPKNEMQVMGTYFNDAGVNLVYDTTAGPDCQPETAALFRFCRREMPDLVILSHSNNGSLVDSPSAFIPSHYKNRSAQLASVVGLRCAKDGFPKHSIPSSMSGYSGETFYQGDGIYHTCGALPILIEFPYGYHNLPDNHKEIMEIGLAALDEISRFGAHYQYRPTERRWK